MFLLLPAAVGSRLDEVFESLRLDFGREDAVGTDHKHEPLGQFLRITGGFRAQLFRKRGERQRAAAESQPAERFSTRQHFRSYLRYRNESEVNRATSVSWKLPPLLTYARSIAIRVGESFNVSLRPIQ